jgi:hypothetical protein
VVLTVGEPRKVDLRMSSYVLKQALDKGTEATESLS